MNEESLIKTIREIAIDAVRAVSKPVSVIVATYEGNNTIRISSELKLEATIPSSVGELETGCNVVAIKQDGTNKYFVIAKL